MAEWQPIETAPRDKTIIVWHPHYRRPVTGHVLAGDIWGPMLPGFRCCFRSTWSHRRPTGCRCRNRRRTAISDETSALLEGQ